MKEVLETLILINKKNLIDRLVASGYAFAAWKKPGDNHNNLIVSLDGCSQLSGYEIADLKTGFLINDYKDAHPTFPFHIQADLIIKEEHLEISPTVNDTKLDSFLKAIQEVETSKPIDKKSSIELSNSDKNEFENLVSEAVNQIRESKFEKVVVSNYREDELPEDFSVWNYFKLLSDSYPNAFCSLTFVPGKGIWVGATPELLISDNTDCFKTVALAGTKKLEENQPLNKIAWTQKEIEEQAFVSRYVVNCFKKLRLREFHEHGPKTIKAGDLAHLKTAFEVKYDEVSFDRLSDQMLELLHPTSAVCGMPVEQTKPWIAEHESYDREFYSGFLGPVNYENSTDLFVNLRCAKVDKGVIRFYAGAGITEDSNSAKEFEETEIKINVLRNLLKR